MSFRQEWRWLADQLSPEDTGNNVPLALTLRGAVSAPALAAALAAEVERHESLRTRFVSSGGKPVQRIDPPWRPALPFVDLGGLPPEAAELESSRLAAVESPELARYIDEVLAPGGWEKLRATDPSRTEGSVNLAINIPESLRDQIWEAAKADPAGTTLTAKVNEGLGEYLAGRFTMPEWVDQRSVQPEKRVNLNVSASRLLTVQASEKVREESGDRRASAARVASIRSRRASLPPAKGEALMLTMSSAPLSAWSAIGPFGLHASSQTDTPTRTPPMRYS